MFTKRCESYFLAVHPRISLKFSPQVAKSSVVIDRNKNRFKHARNGKKFAIPSSKRNRSLPRRPFIWKRPTASYCHGYRRKICSSRPGAKHCARVLIPLGDYSHSGIYLLRRPFFRAKWQAIIFCGSKFGKENWRRRACHITCRKSRIQKNPV